MKKVIMFLILMAFVSTANAKTIYKWMDRQGVINFSDDPNTIPPTYRDRVEKEVVEEMPITIPSVPPQIALQKNEEVRRDIYGRDETWWRDKVRPWKEELKDATANYEKINQIFIEKAEALSRMRYGSPTQYKMKIIELDRANQERLTYEEKINEANQMLEKLFNEATESKANPDWFN